MKGSAVQEAAEARGGRRDVRSSGRREGEGEGRRGWGRRIIGFFGRTGRRG